MSYRGCFHVANSIAFTVMHRSWAVLGNKSITATNDEIIDRMKGKHIPCIGCRWNIYDQYDIDYLTLALAHHLNNSDDCIQKFRMGFL